MKELLIQKGFDVIDLGGILRVFYKKGESFKTLRELREIIPNERIDTFYGCFDIVLKF